MPKKWIISIDLLQLTWYCNMLTSYTLFISFFYIIQFQVNEDELASM